MRGIALVGLLLLCASCAPHRTRPLPGVGVLIPPGRGGCTHVVVGGGVRRVCLPPRPPADTIPRDTLVTIARAGDAEPR